MKSKATFVVSRYKEDFSWLKDYTDNYIVFNKGSPIDDPHVRNVENIGSNQGDICKFLHDDYESLPELILFIQAFPFDHCNQQRFDELIKNETFTPIESYEHIPVSGVHKKGADGGYMELNNSHNGMSCWGPKGHPCKYSSYDQFMQSIFRDYARTEWIRFSPGSQYLIEKKQALFYPKEFWEYVRSIMPGNNIEECHIVERALHTIFSCTFHAHENFK